MHFLLSRTDDNIKKTKKKKKNPGIRHTDEQYTQLEDAFQRSHSLKKDRKASLATTLGLTEHQVAGWFGHRRVKFIKETIAKEDAAGMKSDGTSKSDDTSKRNSDVQYYI